MNGCSSLDLAIAIAQAGATPSFYIQSADASDLDRTLTAFQTATGHCHLVLPLWREILFDPKMMKVIYEHGVSHCDLFVGGDEITIDWLQEPRIIKALEVLKRKSKITYRIYEPIDTISVPLIDGFYLRGKESAGRTGSMSVKDLFIAQKDKSPEANLIPMGGISRPEHVQWYLDSGACAVGVGSIFAAAAESPLTTQVKTRMIESSKQDLTLLSDTQQNALIFDQESVKSDGTWNRNYSLQKGVSGQGDQGHVYVGHAVEDIKEIKSVQMIVDNLMSFRKKKK